MPTPTFKSPGSEDNALIIEQAVGQVESLVVMKTPAGVLSELIGPNGEIAGGAGGLAAHEADTTNIHGIVDTTLLDTIALRDAAIATHAALADPHTVYQKESEKGVANGYADLNGSTRVPQAKLGSGTADATTFLRGDATWQVGVSGAPSGPAAAHRWIRGLDTGARSFEFLIQPGGIIQLTDQGGTTRAQFVTAVNVGSFFRFEWRVVQSTTAGVLEGKLFNSPDSATPTETQLSTGAFSTLVQTNKIRFGPNSAPLQVNMDMYLDNILINDTGYPGPVAVPSSYSLLTEDASMRNQLEMLEPMVMAP